MATLLERGMALASAGVASAAGVSAVYGRGAASVTLTAVAAAPRAATAEESGVLTEMQVIDWLFDAADLILSAVLTTPAAGDRIASAGSTYEVMSPSTGEPCWRYRDPPANTMVRAHTKRVA